MSFLKPNLKLLPLRFKLQIVLTTELSLINVYIDKQLKLPSNGVMFTPFTRKVYI